MLRRHELDCVKARAAPAHTALAQLLYCALPYLYRAPHTGSDKKIKEFEEAPGSGTQITREIDAGTNLTQVRPSARCAPRWAATSTPLTQHTHTTAAPGPLCAHTHNHNLTQVCLLPNAKSMFAATESGNLRTYKFPLTGATGGAEWGGAGCDGGVHGCAVRSGGARAEQAAAPLAFPNPTSGGRGGSSELGVIASSDASLA